MESHYTNPAGNRTQHKPGKGVAYHSEADCALAMIREMMSFRIEPQRLSLGVTKTYTAVKLDGESHKPVLRLYLDRPVRSIGVLTIRKVEEKYPINDLTELVHFYKDMVMMIEHYDK